MPPHRVALGVMAIAVVVMAAAACGGVEVRRANLQELQARAAFDLGCAPASLGLYPFDERSKGVTGCGRRLTYVEVCDAALGSCIWRADGAPSTDVSAVRPPDRPVDPRPPAPPKPVEKPIDLDERH